jgi:hypothetical protein
MSDKPTWDLRTTEWGRICWTCRVCGRQYEQPRPPARCACGGRAPASSPASAPAPAKRPGLRLVDDDPTDSA